MPKAERDRLFFDLQDDLDRICKRFKNPKITLVVRAPQLEDGDLVIGNDDLTSAIGAIRRLQERAPDYVPGDGAAVKNNKVPHQPECNCTECEGRAAKVKP